MAYSLWEWGVTKDWVFHGARVDGGESINQKEYSNFLVVELGIVISTGQSNWEVPWFAQRLGKHEVDICGCGKN